MQNFPNTLFGTDGSDDFLGTEENGYFANTTIRSGAGDDIVYKAASFFENIEGSSAIYTGAGNDHVIAFGDDDTIDSGAGDDFVEIAFGKDEVYGGDGIDQILAYVGTGTLIGGAGDDQIVVTEGQYKISGGTGNDLILSFGDAAFGDHFGYAGTNANELIGGKGDDRIISARGDDTIKGGGGDDLIHVVMQGEDSSNTVKASGGRGEDTFIFSMGDSTTADRVVVQDFDVVNDVMLLDIYNNFGTAFGATSDNQSTSQEQFEFFMEGAVQKKKGVLWTGEEGSQIMLKGVDLDDLTVAHFLSESDFMV